MTMHPPKDILRGVKISGFGTAIVNRTDTPLGLRDVTVENIGGNALIFKDNDSVIDGLTANNVSGAAIFVEGHDDSRFSRRGGFSELYEREILEVIHALNGRQRDTLRSKLTEVTLAPIDLGEMAAALTLAPGLKPIMPKLHRDAPSPKKVALGIIGLIDLYRWKLRRKMNPIHWRPI